MTRIATGKLQRMPQDWEAASRFELNAAEAQPARKPQPSFRPGAPGPLAERPEPGKVVPLRRQSAVPARADDRGPALRASEPQQEQQVADQLLVERAQSGDMRAFELLLRKYQHRIIHLVSRLVGEADAPDVAQETFIRAYRALNGFRGQSAFFTWLYRVGINTAKNHLVSRGRRPTGQDIDIAEAELYGHSGQLSDIETPESLMLSGEIGSEVARAIRKLPADLRQAFMLRELDGLSYEEIAQVMGCPVGTVRSRIFRARESIDATVQHLIS